jgi:hypothetical protein
VAIAEALRPTLHEVVDEIVSAVRAEVPEYGGERTAGCESSVRAAASAAIERFLALLSAQPHDKAGVDQMHVELGRAEQRAGRSIGGLLAAYRTGARVMWQSFSATGRDADIAPDALYRLAGALFAYVDQLSAESSAGYTEEQALSAEEREHERERLLQLLANDTAPDPSAVRAQAIRAQWKLSGRLGPIATPREAGAPALRLPAAAMTARLDGMTVVLVPELDAPGRRAEIERAFADRPAAAAAPVPWRQLGSSIRRVALAARLQQAGVLPSDGLIDADSHLVSLVLHQNPDLAQALCDRALRPLDALPAAARERLTETLDAWLTHGRDTAGAARVLHVHVQTLRYRLRRLDDVLGPERLADPDGRLELQLALRYRRGRRDRRALSDNAIFPVEL